MSLSEIEKEKLILEVNALKTPWYKKPAMVLAILSFIAAFIGVYGQYLFSNIQAETTKNELALAEIRLSEIKEKETNLSTSIDAKKKELERTKAKHEELIAALEKLGIVKEQQSKLSDKDKETSDAYKTVVSAIDREGSQWSYVGKYKDGSYISKHFGVLNIPDIGQHIIATDDVFKRDNKPIYTQEAGWVMGEIVGLVKSGSRLNVEHVEEVPGTGGSKLIWVKGFVK